MLYGKKTAPDFIFILSVLEETEEMKLDLHLTHSVEKYSISAEKDARGGLVFAVIIEYELAKRKLST